ncbi:MAG: hypothetical protein Q7J75_04535 [Rhodoferax sp.]|nr:hypothetical protein [Rhodoferax sp.]
MKYNMGTGYRKQSDGADKNAAAIKEPRSKRDLAFKDTTKGVLLIAGLLISSISLAQSCPPNATPPKQKQVLYQVQDRQLWRDETQTGKRTLVKGIDDVQSVAQSVLNCVNQVERSHEANMIAVSKTDGTVWIRGVIWDYRHQECAVVACDDPKGPQRMLDTKGQWKQILGFKDVMKVVAGETWVAALTRSRKVVAWGTNNGGMLPLGTKEEQKNHTPLLMQTPQTVFGFPAYRDIVAFNNVAYGLMIDGQVTAWARESYICRIEEHRKTDGFKYVCPFVYPHQGSVERIWQTANNPEECNAAFLDGQLWQWPCDLRDDVLALVPPIVPDRIRKSRPTNPSSQVPSPPTGS